MLLIIKLNLRFISIWPFSVLRIYFIYLVQICMISNNSKKLNKFQTMSSPSDLNLVVTVTRIKSFLLASIKLLRLQMVSHNN